MVIVKVWKNVVVVLAEELGGYAFARGLKSQTKRAYLAWHFRQSSGAFTNGQRQLYLLKSKLRKRMGFTVFGDIQTCTVSDEEHRRCIILLYTNGGARTRQSKLCRV